MASALDMSARQKAALNRRFVRGAGCWLWTGPLTPKGYGHISFRTPAGRTSTTAHRAVYELLRGEVPAGLHLDHLCRVRNCVRPDHLEPVTPAENNLRSIAAAGPNGAARWNARKTHCPKGHAYDATNTYLIPSTGGRQCRTCERSRSAARRLAQRAA